MKSLEKLVGGVKRGLKSLAYAGLVGTALLSRGRVARAEWLDNYTPPPGFRASKVIEETENIESLVYNDVNPMFPEGLYYSAGSKIYYLSDSGEKQVFADIGAYALTYMAFSHGNAFGNFLYVTNYRTGMQRIDSKGDIEEFFDFGERTHGVAFSNNESFGESLFSFRSSDVVRITPEKELEIFAENLACEESDLAIGKGSGFGRDLYVLEGGCYHKIWSIGVDREPIEFVDYIVGTSITFSEGGLFGNHLYSSQYYGSGVMSLFTYDSNGNREPFGSGKDYFRNLDFKGAEALYLSSGSSIYKITPEPSTLGLLSAGLVGAGIYGLRRRKK